MNCWPERVTGPPERSRSKRHRTRYGHGWSKLAVSVPAGTATTRPTTRPAPARRRFSRSSSTSPLASGCRWRRRRPPTGLRAQGALLRGELVAVVGQARQHLELAAHLYSFRGHPAADAYPRDVRLAPPGHRVV